MAVTKIIPIRTTIQRSVDYICNPHKTDGKLLIHSEHCFQQTAGLIFHHHLAQTRAGGNTLGRHLIQSFAPGEVDPDTAHEIGKKMATEILGGEYAFVMATHVDCGHVHNHFVWGAANIVTHKRYRSNVGTYHEIRKISDRLCKESELSVIVPNGTGKSYAEYQAERTGRSWKGKLRQVISATILESSNFEDFITRMKSQSYVVKRGNQPNTPANSPQLAANGNFLTDSHGRINLNHLAPGVYHVRVATSLSGYQANTDVHVVTVLPGQQAVLECRFNIL